MLESIHLWVGQTFLSSGGMRLLLLSLVLVVVLLVLQGLLSRLIRRSLLPSESRRKWLVQSRNALLLLGILGLFMIWGEELRTLALSVVAIAVALVVATKELILCLTGSLLKSAARTFDIGDRIQIKDFRGDVIDQNLLTTTLMEVGPGKLTHQRTGRTLVLPNALFVAEPVVNESFTGEFVLHVFTLPLLRTDPWQETRNKLTQAAEQQSAPYLEEAKRYMQRLSGRLGLEIPSVEPRVTLQFPDAEEVHLVVRVPVRASQKSFIEQSILNQVFIDQDSEVINVTES
ncbi:mechanosensitive ion channel domain-containing protein [Marinospirillum sp.]|uniref:mechanosensitive ion channel domain-containing protein n=1 Tax=Marinospirillum sp. TaxID=2183934 RepID=UPI00287047C4|nr:mechanosensitive ion channel domain-containing protein [Marinospirillum sp.]MDR9468901.1 mechanosensitive ion channel [Marinospirillum sp.]